MVCAEEIAGCSAARGCSGADGCIGAGTADDGKTGRRGARCGAIAEAEECGRRFGRGADRRMSARGAAGRALTEVAAGALGIAITGACGAAARGRAWKGETRLTMKGPRGADGAAEFMGDHSLISGPRVAGSRGGATGLSGARGFGAAT